ncbi:hypothetical protein WICMUC_005355 [Wickerhamomyces mucosus]|uniref:Uncharacterized protein n=1 Tax=Wickerhamomyces mucosus TaxID=1378264 RepID=A0A9P8T5I1_9ASCO|nr:hypothetical protein WICMUC_005355 [Wickerhamomyces mucosus]
MLSARTSSVTKNSVLNFKRSIATSYSKTQFTSLSNGITVATESNPAAKSATLGLWVGAGSTSENPYNNGVSNFLNNTIVSGASKEAAKLGLQFGGQTAKEFSAYYTQGLKSSLPQALDLLNAKVSSLDLTSESVLKQRELTTKAIEHFEENDHAGRVLEHLHATAFQNTPLALPTRGTVETVSELIQSDLESFHRKNFVSSNTVVVASGDVKHEDVVELVEKKLKIQTGSAPEIAEAKFLGSEVRLRDDTLPAAWVSIAHQGEALSSPNYYVAKVAAQIFGDYNYHEPISRNLGVKLTGVVGENHLADTYNHFSLSYKSGGLWGFATETSNVQILDDLTHFTLKEWNRLSVSITETEVARGKQLLKNKVLFELSSPLAVANDIGSSVLATGRRASADEIFAQIDKVDVSSIKKWAGSRLWDQDIAVAGTGQIEDLFDYMRLRNETALLRW